MVKGMIRRGGPRISGGAILCALVLLATHTAVEADEPSPPVWPGRFHAAMTQNSDGDLGIVDLWYDFAGGRNLNVIQMQSGEEDGPLFDNEQANGTGYYYLPAKAKAKYCNVIDFGVGIIKPDWLKGATYLGEEKSGIYDCYKWEQGEIPESHLRFLGLRAGSVSDTETDTNLAHNSQTTQRRTHLGGGGDGEFFPSRVGGDEAAARERELQQRDDASVSLRGDRGGGRETAKEKEGPFMTYWSEKGTDRPVKWVFFTGAEFEVIRFDVGATMHDELFQIPDYCF